MAAFMYKGFSGFRDSGDIASDMESALKDNDAEDIDFGGFSVNVHQLVARGEHAAREGENPTDLDHYEGQTKNGKAHGSGEMKWASGDMYKGAFVEGVPEGEGTYTDVNGATFTGNFVGGRRNGRGVLQWGEKGAKFYGEWRNDRQLGGGLLMLSEKNLGRENSGFYVGDWKDDGVPDGEGKAINLFEHTIYVGEYKDGKRDGKGKMLWKYDGSKYSYDGEWKKGKQHGKGTYTSPDGTKKGEWKNGKFQSQEVEDDEVEFIGQFSAMELVARKKKKAEENGDVTVVE